MAAENIYFIAIIPPGEICDDITSFRLDFANRFASNAALRIIPHITLKAPFKLPASSYSDLQKWFYELPVPLDPFNVALQGFEAFANKRNPVIFVQPLMNTGLAALQKSIIGSFRKMFPYVEITNHELQFNPHITVAYRDLSTKDFAAAWKEYQTKDYHASFKVSTFHLLQHDGKVWNVVETYRM